jgi:hypothetical protein
MEVVSNPKQILRDSAEIGEIKKMEGIMRIDLEHYSIMGSAEQIPVFVVVANSNFRERPKIPGNPRKRGVI